MIEDWARRLAALALVVMAGVYVPYHAYAHDGAGEGAPQQSLPHAGGSEDTDGFPVLKSGDFDLIDQNGMRRTSIDPDGRYQLVFFGYASCKSTCPVALPTMAAAVELLADAQLPVTPVLITVDPERDTQEALKQRVAQLHPRMVGLTGSENALARAYKAFQIEKSLLFVHPDEGPVYAHGSFIYLLGPQGDFKTLFLPVFSPERIARVSASYISGAKQAPAL